jgi:hypothetical protein
MSKDAKAGGRTQYWEYEAQRRSKIFGVSLTAARDDVILRYLKEAGNPLPFADFVFRFGHTPSQAVLRLIAAMITAPRTDSNTVLPSQVIASPPPFCFERIRTDGKTGAPPDPSIPIRNEVLARLMTALKEEGRGGRGAHTRTSETLAENAQFDVDTLKDMLKRMKRGPEQGSR